MTRAGSSALEAATWKSVTRESAGEWIGAYSPLIDARHSPSMKLWKCGIGSEGLRGSLP